jgi:hypothetical protein
VEGIAEEAHPVTAGVHLGFELVTGRAIVIPIGHLAATGQTQASGKTTLLEGLVSRSDCRAVAFLTKRGEGSFRVASTIPPYFKDRTDWPFIRSILEAASGEKLKFELAQIINLCQNHDGPEGHWEAPKTLADVLANAETALAGKARGFVRNVYTVLTEYLRGVVPEIGRLPYTNQIELRDGLSVMDLIDYQFPLQSLVVRSVIEWIHHHEIHTIVVIPEAWKFAPKQRGSPVRLAAEEFIRQGGALKNFLWIDSQDLASVSGVLLRQVKVWLFGVQRDPHEIERTLQHIPAHLAKPNKRDLATLGVGQFVVCWEKQMFRCYVQPAWMTAAHAEAIARGEEPVESARAIVREFDQEHAHSEEK